VRGARRTRRGIALCAAAGLALSAAGAGAEDLRWVEAPGVGRAEPNEVRGGPGYQAALRQALGEAVVQAAVDELAAASAPDAPDRAALEERVRGALGDDPLPYVARYQIREDRGVQPRLLLPDPTAKAEYQLVVMAQIDLARVRGRLGTTPEPVYDEDLLPPEADAPVAPPTARPARGPRPILLTYEDVTSFRDYRTLRDVLTTEAGAEDVVPVEFSRHRATLRLSSPLPPAELAESLARALAGRYRLVALEASDATDGPARLRLRVLPPEDRGAAGRPGGSTGSPRASARREAEPGGPPPSP